MSELRLCLHGFSKREALAFRRDLVRELKKAGVPAMVGQVQRGKESGPTRPTSTRRARSKTKRTGGTK